MESKDSGGSLPLLRPVLGGEKIGYKCFAIIRGHGKVSPPLREEEK